MKRRASENGKSRGKKQREIRMKIFARMLRHRGILAVVLLTVALPVLTQAHAKLEKTVPADKAALTAPPTSVQLWFSEKPDAAVSKIELKGPSGVVKLGPAHVMGEKTLMADIMGAIGDGTYTVNWQTSGDDGHVQKGLFTFSLKRAH
jgi:methionine-rich copper-binding protein CopC